MSTRWQISALLRSGEHACIYVHCDGYPSYALETLKAHYTNQEKIDALIAGGDCLSIGKELSDCETFLSRGDEWEDVCPTHGNGLKEVADKHRHGDEEYRYFWNGQSWFEAGFD